MTMQPELRRCSAVRCQTQVKRALLMCPKHWSQLPAALQAEVHRTLRAWKGGSTSHDYLLAVNRAQLHIAEAEGLPYTAAIKDMIAALEAKVAKS